MKDALWREKTLDLQREASESSVMLLLHKVSIRLEDIAFNSFRKQSKSQHFAKTSEHVSVVWSELLFIDTKLDLVKVSVSVEAKSLIGENILLKFIVSLRPNADL